MVYLYTCICELIFILWSYLFVKTYQLSGYKIETFLKNVAQLNLSFGDKNKLVFTKRLVRFIITLTLLSLAFFFCINFFIENIFIKLFDILLVFLCQPLILSIAHFIICPLEIAIKKFYMWKASNKLKGKNIIKIGITGSFGKTSTKNILASILQKKYRVCVSPKNYNTEMGLSKTILTCFNRQEVFIAEMGARRQGDIKTLAKMVKPNYGIITTIGKQHLETFKTLENIKNTKYELVENMPPDGVVVFNGDSKETKELFERFDGEKYLTCDESGFAYAKNIVTDRNGSTFDMFIKDKKWHMQTKLLGKCNIDNIVTAASLSYILGVSEKDIIDSVSSLLPAKHRLELLKNSTCTIIDDSYNSNIVGAKEALQVLKNFDGKKVVITPGIVELGVEQSLTNFTLGTMIADVADEIIIMNKVNKNELLSGAISHNFDRKHIYFAETRKKQKEILEKIVTKDCIILFENDLPDNYN